MNDFNDVGEFHAKFGLPYYRRNWQGPREVTPDLLEFRIKFLHEELEEFEEAVGQGDHAKSFDALIDLNYVSLGTAHLFNYPWQVGWKRVQEANMAKVRAKADGSDSARGSSFDVIKPPGWKAPDIAELLRQQGWFIP